ncbi:hypothetical protein K437DRAFT_123490 [Tilletiaria anomala UBC 951]|uniref:Uncharacterized protein n=1 Tax=Tilletiaria anomala (strain ATCC 24038 / CBS 436.72 / UBC 951) TaxID=1037660 RepID=A0A066W3G4_TILAU|nr:uncharacterized protein K437DRAFT_123490 [Tilletiaria anomala UBC 951]KDN45305.1 hypothetical protein K437DRAFT_123490 [Tilletiaria anomala UBC 951]
MQVLSRSAVPVLSLGRCCTCTFVRFVCVRMVDDGDDNAVVVMATRRAKHERNEKALRQCQAIHIHPSDSRWGSSLFVHYQQRSPSKLSLPLLPAPDPPEEQLAYDGDRDGNKSARWLGASRAHARLQRATVRLRQREENKSATNKHTNTA